VRTTHFRVNAGIAVDSAGSAYVSGYALSTDFPTANPIQMSNRGNADVFVTKLTPDGSGLVYSTYLGGSGQDWGGGIAVDSSGNAYVTGQTASSNFPTTPGAFQTSKPSSGINPSAFVTELNSTGSLLLYSTYLGGNLSDYGFAIAVDSAGRASVTGLANSHNFPTTVGAPQSTIGGGGDAFVTTLVPGGGSLVFSTYLGGKINDQGYGIAVDSSRNIYVAGETASSNFPLVNPLQEVFGGSEDAFVAKLNPFTSALVYSTYLGGSASDYGFGVAVDSAVLLQIAERRQGAA
jgi:Beta-propeller repeat